MSFAERRHMMNAVCVVTHCHKLKVRLYLYKYICLYIITIHTDRVALQNSSMYIPYQLAQIMCNICQLLPATAVIQPHTGFDETQNSIAKTCHQCADSDTTNVYVQNAALCGHGMK
jgi:hypothetical protein